MDNNKQDLVEMYRQNAALAKLILTKYNMLHQFHIDQLEYFSIACCKTAIDGQVEVDFDNKTVRYDIKTESCFSRDSKTKIVRSRHKYSPIRIFSNLFGKYEMEKKMAYENLRGWTRQLLWADSKVQVRIDGKVVSG